VLLRQLSEFDVSIGLEFDLSSVERLQRRIERLANPDRRRLLEQMAGMVESQTRERITSGGEQAPDGEPWQAWTARYAANSRSNHSMLDRGGDLSDSITWEVNHDEAEVGSNLDYAAIHQHGGTPGMAPGPAGIPAREYLGFSQGNLDDIEAVADTWLDNHLKKT